MKREYKSPKVVKVDYAYNENVVAQSTATCSGSHYVYQTATGCNQYKFTDYKTMARTLHPCDWVVEGEPFPN